MAKLVFGILMSVIWWMLHALQVDEELSLQTLHEAKRAIDRAAHAAAQQVDRDLLETGRLALDSEKAETAALSYLRANLRLGVDLEPVPGSFLREKAEIAEFAIVNDDAVFPYTYRSDDYDYEVTLERPGVVLIVHVAYPRLFGVVSPIEWDIKGAAEIVYD